MTNPNTPKEGRTMTDIKPELIEKACAAYRRPNRMLTNDSATRHHDCMSAALEAVYADIKAEGAAEEREWSRRQHKREMDNLRARYEQASRSAEQVDTTVAQPQVSVVELVAKSIYERLHSEGPGWEALQSAWREAWLDDARTALEAVPSTPQDPTDCGASLTECLQELEADRPHVAEDISDWHYAIGWDAALDRLRSIMADHGIPVSPTSDDTDAPEPSAAPDADHESPPCDSGREQPLTEDQWSNLRIENPPWRCTDPEWPVFRWLVGVDPHALDHLREILHDHGIPVSPTSDDTGETPYEEAR